MHREAARHGTASNKALNEFVVIYFYMSKWSTSMSTDDDVDDHVLIFFSSLFSKYKQEIKCY